MSNFEKERREALNAGNRALRSLKEAQDNLNSAKNWGVWDMLGGGLISTMAKYSKMDRAKENMEEARYDLKNFSKELNDVDIACHLDIETDDFLSFADYFFDGFIVDWLVQDRIDQASRQVAEAIQRVERILAQLQ